MGFARQAGIIAALAALGTMGARPLTEEEAKEEEARRAEREQAYLERMQRRRMEEAARHPATQSKPRSEALERMIGKRKFKYRSRP